MSNRNRPHAGRKLALFATASLFAIASPAFAQVAAETSAEVADVAPVADEAASDIIVTGSRVARSGFSAPTPTTVLSSDEFEKVAAPNLADVVNQMP